MDITQNNLEDILLNYMDQLKLLLAPKIWENILFDCSKNELLILFLLYRHSNVNMSQVAEYIQVPLNTATGIVARMEKKQLLLRERSAEDKRVVTIELAQSGHTQIQEILKEFLYYGQLLVENLSPDELALAGKILDKVTLLMKKEQSPKETTTTKTRKHIPIL